jgi:hypothetical protein
MFLAFSCGEGATVDVDPAFFEAMRFDCDPRTEDVPSCPPFSCEVNEDGSIASCDESCELDPGSRTISISFAFLGPEGVDLCAPAQCTVGAQNEAPRCDPECSPDDVTTFIFGYDCSTP